MSFYLGVSHKDLEKTCIFLLRPSPRSVFLFELAKTFNCGIGFLIFVEQNDAQLIINDINKIGYNAFKIGQMVENNSNRNLIFDGWNL